METKQLEFLTTGWRIMTCKTKPYENYVAPHPLAKIL